MGQPESGPGSMARAGRRILAICIDWALCYLIANAFFDGNPNAVLAIFAIEQMLLVGFLGYSVGHRIMGIEVVRLDGRQPSLLDGMIRSLLVCLVFPVIIVDADHRGLHDRAIKSILIRR
nr:RDD family protein [Arthrobacter sp. BF1]